MSLLEMTLRGPFLRVAVGSFEPTLGPGIIRANGKLGPEDFITRIAALSDPSALRSVESATVDVTRRPVEDSSTNIYRAQGHALATILTLAI
jgi:hypothetical protein